MSLQFARFISETKTKDWNGYRCHNCSVCTIKEVSYCVVWMGMLIHFIAEMNSKSSSGPVLN